MHQIPIDIIDSIKESFNFYKKNNDKIDYFCSCGEHFSVDDNLNEESDEEFSNILDSGDGMEEFKEAYSTIITGILDEVKCPSCNKNFLMPEVKNTTIKNKNHFSSGFSIDENEEYIKLNFFNIFPQIDNGLDFGFSNKYIKVHKKENKIVYTTWSDEETENELRIENIISFLNEFFKTDKITVFSMYYIYDFLNKMSNLIVDSDKMRINEDILGKSKNQFSQTGVEQAKKALTIIFAVYKHSNFSTVALTKGVNFLYDLILECGIPPVEILKESEATKPLKIFNLLSESYIVKFNDELSGEDRTTRDFVFKSKVKMEIDEEENIIISEGEEREVVFKIKNQEAFDKKRKSKISLKGSGQKKGQINIVESIKDGTISNFIFKSIKSFEDYKQIVKYLKFYTLDELIVLMQKWPVDFLSKSIEYIYHRNSITHGEINHLFSLFTNFLKNNNSLENFDFSYYDDSIICLDYLKSVMPEEEKYKFERNKYFNKIKDYERLIKFHDNINKQRRFYEMSSDNKNELKEIVEKYEYLENIREDSPIKIKLLKSVEDFLNEGAEMAHSAAVYVDKVMAKEYLVAKLLDTTNIAKIKNKKENQRFTLGITIDYYEGLIFDQLKGPKNSPATDRVKKLVISWLEKNEISVTQLNDLKIRNDGSE